MTSIERPNMAEGAGGQGPDNPTGATNQPGTPGGPEGVNSAAAPESRGRGPFGWLRRQPSPRVLVEPGQMTQEAFPKKPHDISPEYDPNRKDYEFRQEGNFNIAIDPKTGKEVARMPRIAGGAGAENWLKEAAAQKQSAFQDANEVVRMAAKFSDAELAQFNISHPRFGASLTDSIRIINKTFRPQTEQEQRELERVLYFIRDDIRRTYVEAMQTTPRADPDSWYGSGSPTPKSLEERLEAVDKSLANYPERFWDYGEATLRRIFEAKRVNTDIRVLRQRYEGAANYLASRVAIAIGKELSGLPLESGELGDFYLADIKRDLEETRGKRERDRREKRKRATADERLHYNNWREKFDFTWAETPEELDDSVEDWLDYFQQALPREAEEAVYQEVQKGMGNALSSLEQARNRIRLEANDARIQALREKIVGHVTTIAGARLVESRGGFEYFIKLKTDFAANYDPYYDGIYLKKGFAIMADKLSENEGEIYRGGSLSLEKPLPGDTKTFRSNLEREAIRYGTSHELYIKEADFETAELGEREIRRQVTGLNLSFEESQRMIKQEMDNRRRTGYKEGRYGWDDSIEELLLVDSLGMFKARSLTDPLEREKAIAKIIARTGVFRKIKHDLDKEDVCEDLNNPGNSVSLASLTPDQRKQVIRQRIEDKIAEEGKLVLLNEIRRLPDQASKDRDLWKWVKDYNKPRIELRREGSSDEPWFPSIWDAERLSITKPEDLIDRVLSADQFKTMVEEVEDPYRGLTGEQIQRQIRNQFKQQVQAVVAVKRLSPQEAEEEFNRLIQEREEVIKGKIEDVLFERKQREARAIRNYNLNIAQDKFLELQARWGGLTTRVITDKGVEMKTIFSLAEEILKAKIDKEEREIEDKVRGWKLGYAATHPGLTPAELNAEIDKQRILFTANTKYKNKTSAEIDQKINEWKLGFVATHPGLTADEIEEATIQQRRLFRRNATFAATLGLREIGIANDLPIWNYFYYGDASQIGAFAPLVGYTHDDKGILPELLDRGRREMEAVFFFLAAKYLDERMLAVVDYPGLVIEDEDGVQIEAHDDRWVRPRVINEGGVFKLRDLFETRMMISTSGGVKVADLISRIAGLGVYDELWENGCKNKREWQGFRRRKNRWELRRQSFLNTREWADPITHVERLAGAANARRLLVGGEVKGQGYQPGVLNEPYNGLWKYRDEFIDIAKWISDNIRKVLSGARKLPKNVNWDKFFRNEVALNESLSLSKPEEVKEYRANVLKVLQQKGMTQYLGTEAKDRLVAVGGEILKFWFDYMNSRIYLRNRASHAPKNWQWDNELIARAFIAESRKREPVIAKKRDFKGFDKDGKPVYYLGGAVIAEEGGEVLGGDHLAYAPEGRTPTGNDMFMTILRGSTYHVFDEADARTLDGRAWRVKTAMDTKRAEIAAEPLPANIQNMLDARELSLVGLNTPPEIIDRELNRLKNYYIDERLHKEFVGEWPAQLVV